VERAAEDLRVRDLVAVAVDDPVRDATRRNHTATHLLHAALRSILGTHVKQAGSLVAPDRLRFDFVHFSALTAEQRAAVEQRVNDEVLKNRPVNTSIRDTQEAIAAGATALFGEKYGDQVRVVAIGDGRFSTELCGGTHVGATGEIGPFLITEESGVAAGVRRIEAVTGLGAIAQARQALDELNGIRAETNVRAGDIAGWARNQQTLLARAQKEIQQLKTRLALGGGAAAGAADDGRVEINGSTLIARQVSGVDKEGLGSLADALKSKLKSGVIIVAADLGGGQVGIVAAVTPDLVKKAPAGQLVKELAPIVGGKGGGRPDFAMAGGKDAAKIGELLAEARQMAERLLAR
jgi:alanyl-tRNA synthetase